MSYPKIIKQVTYIQPLGTEIQIRRVRVNANFCGSSVAVERLANGELVSRSYSEEFSIRNFNQWVEFEEALGSKEA